jgi:hypothetical protein
MTDPFLDFASRACQAARLASDAARSLGERKTFLTVSIECWKAAAAEAFSNSVRTSCCQRAASASRALESMMTIAERVAMADGAKSNIVEVQPIAR